MLLATNDIFYIVISLNTYSSGTSNSGSAACPHSSSNQGRDCLLAECYMDLPLVGFLTVRTSFIVGILQQWDKRQGHAAQIAYLVGGQIDLQLVGFPTVRTSSIFGILQWQEAGSKVWVSPWPPPICLQ